MSRAAAILAILGIAMAVLGLYMVMYTSFHTECSGPIGCQMVQERPYEALGALLGFGAFLLLGIVLGTIRRR